MAPKEFERLQAINRYLELNKNVANELQAIVTMAADICVAPTALITVISGDKQYVKFKKAFDFEEIPREDAFCHETLASKEYFVVPNAAKDIRFAKHPMVIGYPYVIFYAGIPLITLNGQHLGSLCVLNQVPQEISVTQIKILRMLAKHAVHLIEFESGLSSLKNQVAKAKATEVKLKSFFESSTSEHFIIDKEYKILAFNKKLQDFVLREYDLIIEKGMDIRDLVRAQYIDDFVKNCQLAFAGTRVRHERFIHFGKSSRWCDTSYDPAKTPDGNIIGLSYNSTDISERINAQNKLLNQQALLDKTAFLQSHEIRKPVANLKGLLALLALDGKFNAYPGLISLQTKVDQLDEKIKLIVGFTAKRY